MNNNKTIYQQLGLSIKRVNEDEIEIRHSAVDGYLRGFFRVIFIASILMILAVAQKNNEPPFERIYRDIEENFYWAFDPDEILFPLYRKRYLTENAQNSDVYSSNNKINYEAWKKPNLVKFSLKKYLIYKDFFIIFLILLLIFLPRLRGVRLNRKKRVIYMQDMFGTLVAPVPEQGDPLAAITYDRFGIYMFGQMGALGMSGGCKYFSLSMTFALHQSHGESYKAYKGTFGVYPTPHANHNLHLIKAMRAFFNEENPEFLDYLAPRYRLPLSRLGTLFCNALALPIRYKQAKADKAIAAYLAEWQALPEAERASRLSIVGQRQEEINQNYERVGYRNVVNDDWAEIDNTPPHMEPKQ